MILSQFFVQFFKFIILFQFQENEKKRYRAEQQRLNIKQDRQREEVRAAGETALRELEQLQNEKRRALMAHEAAKVRSLEERYAAELREWRAQLAPRKQVSKFAMIERFLYIHLLKRRIVNLYDKRGEEFKFSFLIFFYSKLFGVSFLYIIY